MKCALFVIILSCLVFLPGIHTSSSAQAFDPAVNLPTSVEAEDTFFPEDMDPPEECGVPLNGPFGKDVEIYMGGDIANRIDLLSQWMAAQEIPGSAPVGNINAGAAGTENVVAAWKDGGNNVWFSRWQTTETTPAGAWEASTDLGFQVEGEPIIIAKSELEYEVYARQAGKIYVSVLTDTLSIQTSSWVALEGINNAASDVVVVHAGPNHTVVLYLDAAGRVWFTEYSGGWAWRDDPIALTTNWMSYLPLVSAGQYVNNHSTSTAPVTEISATIFSGPGSFQTLNAISRRDDQLTIIAVDQENQLWVSEWSSIYAEDWESASWVMLAEGVSLQRPSVVSRHVNHIGVIFHELDGDPAYLEWTSSTGWTQPQSLPQPVGLSLISPLSMVAIATDTFWVFGVDADGNIQRMIWSEAAGWGEWEVIAYGYAPDQVLAVDMRRYYDVLVVGRTVSGSGASLLYTSQGGEATSTALMPPLEDTYQHGSQVLAWVDGSVLLVTAHLYDDLGQPYMWEVEAYELVADDLRTGMLLLDNHLFLEENIVSMAAGDLDFDGSDEIVIATRAGTYYTNNTQISVLDLNLSSFVYIDRVETLEVLTDYYDISLDIGDLDGNGRQDEVAFGGVTDMGVIGTLFRYDPEVEELEEIFNGTLRSTPWEYRHELEISIGRLYPRNPAHLDSVQQYLGEQLVVLDTIRGYPDYNLSANLGTYTLITGTWTVEPVQNFPLNTVLCPGGCMHPYRSALDTGDVDADGYTEIVAWHGSLISLVDPFTDQIETETYDPLHDPNNGQAMAVGDIDLDGRAEILAGGQQYLSIYEVLGDHKLARTKWQQWDDAWGTAIAVLAHDLDHDTFISELVGCESFNEARVTVVMNGAPRWYENGLPAHNSLGSFSKARGGESSSETGTSHSFGGSLTIGFEQSIGCPFTGLELASFRFSVANEFMRTSGQSEVRKQELIYGITYYFDDRSLGHLMLNVRSYTCYFYELYPPGFPELTTRAMTCTPQQHNSLHQSLNWWNTVGKVEYADSWAPVGHHSPGGVATNNLEEAHNYPSSLPVDYRLVYDWAGVNDNLLCGDSNPGSVEWWAEDASGYSKGRQYMMEENTTVSTGSSTMGVGVDIATTTGDAWSSSESFGWTQEVGFQAGVTQIYDDPADAGDDRRCYKIVPYVYQARAQTLSGFSYPYLELDFYVPCIGCGLP